MRHWAIGAAVLGTAAIMALSGCQDLTSPGSTSEHATTTTAASQWTMPNLVGTNLQTAQDRIQSLTGDPIFITGSHDATGRHRHQILDRDWQVCSQNIAAGKVFTASTKIDFGAVKLAENCP